MKRPKIFALPEDVQAELFARLAESQFGDYEKHETWLRDKGHEVGKSSIHRAAEPYEQIIHLVRRARFLRGVTRDAIDIAKALEILAITDQTKAIRGLAGAVMEKTR